MKRSAWFGRKRIGWGLRPVSWQGWAVTGGYVAVVVVVTAGVKAHHLVRFEIELAVITAVYLVIAFLTNGGQ
ncbi:MAG: hypothetical protein ACLQUT_01925 [Thermoleophilia bacterium]